MSGCVILNEASIPFQSAEDCERNLNTFFSILHCAHLEGVGFYRPDDIEGNWNSLIYATGFELGQWINRLDDKDQYRTVASVLANVRCPYFKGVNESIEKTLGDLLHFLEVDKTVEVRGLGLASLIDCHGLSFASHKYWLQNPVSIVRENYSGTELESQKVAAQNIFSVEHMEDVARKIRDRKQENRQYMRTLTARGNPDFPNLIFCSSALADLRSSAVTIDDHPRIIDVLNKLNWAITRSKNLMNLVENTQLDISGESPETMSCSKHFRKRIFNHPDLGRTIFEVHVKNFPNAKRMHILADYSQSTVCIGYFGHHLSTVSNPK